MTIKEELIQYAKDCINDTKHCCQKHRWACERFLRDISREGTDEFPYIFDDAKAERFYKWASLHKHTKGVLVNTPIILHQYSALYLVIFMDGFIKILDTEDLQKHIGK